MKNSRLNGRQLILIIAAPAVLSILIYLVVSNWMQGRPKAAERRIAATSETAMAATANHYATKAGVDILKKGGNAVDAAVAAAFALGVVEPFASGIGGGGFMLIYTAKTRQIIAIDYRERAPLKATPKMFRTLSGRGLKDRLKEGHRAVAVPGTMAGLALALKNYGTMDLKSVMAPAVKLAENGFEVGKLLHSMMKSNAPKLSKYPAAAGIFLKEGVPYKTGDRLYLKDLAVTYRLIAEKGPEVFYKGSIAETIEKEMIAGKGLITKKDLAAYEPILRTPVKGSYRGYEIFSMGPSSSGGMHIIEFLNILEGYDMARSGLNTMESITLMAAAMKAVFSDREKYMGDPGFVEAPLKSFCPRSMPDV